MDDSSLKQLIKKSLFQEVPWITYSQLFLVLIRRFKQSTVTEWCIVGGAHLVTGATVKSLKASLLGDVLQEVTVRLLTSFINFQHT